MLSSQSVTIFWSCHQDIAVPLECCWHLNMGQGVVNADTNAALQSSASLDDNDNCVTWTKSRTILQKYPCKNDCDVDIVLDDNFTLVIFAWIWNIILHSKSGEWWICFNIIFIWHRSFWQICCDRNNLKLQSFQINGTSFI